MIRQTPRSTLLPYTTLFRSRNTPTRAETDERQHENNVRVHNIQTMRRPNSTNRAKTDRVARETGQRTHVGSSTAQPRHEIRLHAQSQTKDNMKTMSQCTTYRQ